MKIADALILRKEYKTVKNNLERRIRRNAKVEKGGTPNEDVLKLVDEWSEVEEKLRKLIIKINHNNLNTTLESGMIVADAIAYKNSLMNKKNMLDNLMHESMGSSYRDDPIEPCVDIGDIQKKISLISKEYREINSQIQLSNWQTELV